MSPVLGNLVLLLSLPAPFRNLVPGVPKVPGRGNRLSPPVRAQPGGIGCLHMGCTTMPTTGRRGSQSGLGHECSSPAGQTSSSPTLTHTNLTVGSRGVVGSRGTGGYRDVNGSRRAVGCGMVRTVSLARGLQQPLQVCYGSLNPRSERRPLLGPLRGRGCKRVGAGEVSEHGPFSACRLLPLRGWDAKIGWDPST